MKTDTLKPSQVMTILAVASLGIDILIEQNSMVSYAGRDAWISLLLGGITGILFGSIMYFLASAYPGKSFPEIAVDICGRFIGRLFMLPVLIYILLHAGLSINIFAQTIKMFLLDRTPMYAIVAVMAAVAVYAVYKGIFTLSGVIDIIFPLAVITIAALILISLQQAEVENIFPILYKSHMKVLRGSFFGLLHFPGFGHVAYLLCYAQDSKVSIKWYIIGTAIPVVLATALTLVTIMVFNPLGIESLLFPTLTLSKSIEFPVTFLERLESIVAVLWISIAFGSISLFTFVSVQNFLIFFGRKSEKYVTLAHFPLLMIVALFIKNGMKVIEYYLELKYLLAAFVFIFSPMLAVLSVFQKRRQIRN
ncbi:MAG TPA: endospore germination permease [Clostridiales bacterium]|nr:endospore germination permease [Clostridiales bacterium]